MLPSSGTERKAVPSRFYGPARPNFHPITDLANRPARISARQLGSARDDPNRCPNRRAIYNTRVTEIDNTRNSCSPPPSSRRHTPLRFFNPLRRENPRDIFREFSESELMKSDKAFINIHR